MKIQEKRERYIADSEDRRIKFNDEVLMVVAGKPIIGIFQGITARGSLSFIYDVNDIKCSFKVMPKSIETIRLLVPEECNETK